MNAAAMIREAVAAPLPDAIDLALKAATSDPGALFEPAALELLRVVRESTPARYARVRATAKELRVQVGELDRLTATASADAGDTDMFPTVEPWPDPVDGAALLTDIAVAIKRFVVADQATFAASALWTAHTYFMDVLTVSPIANITAPEKRCGKTVLLSALGKVACRPMQTSNIAPAALFRAVEMWQPTLLIDEVDSFLRDNEEARGIINSGLYRDGAYVVRCVGDDHTPTRFSTWGAKALCGIGVLADTLADRSIPLRLRRKMQNEQVENLRNCDAALWGSLRSRLVRWATDNAEKVATCTPDKITGLHDRANDCWEPLLAIAEIAGSIWPNMARKSAIALHGVEDDAPSIGAELLADIKAVFDRRRVDRLPSVELLAGLVEDEEAPWATWNRGKPMNARQLSKRLAEFGIKSGTVRLSTTVTKQGFHLSQFTEAFARYLFSPEGGGKSHTRTQSNNGADFSVCDEVTHAPIAHATHTPEPALQSHCVTVCDSSGVSGQGIRNRLVAVCLRNGISAAIARNLPGDDVQACAGFDDDILLTYLRGLAAA